MRRFIAALCLCCMASGHAETISVVRINSALQDLTPDDGSAPYLSDGGLPVLTAMVAAPNDLGNYHVFVLGAHSRVEVTLDWDLTFDIPNNEFASRRARIYGYFDCFPMLAAESVRCGGVIGGSAIFENGSGPYDSAQTLYKTFSFRDQGVWVENISDEPQRFAWFPNYEMWFEPGIYSPPLPVPEPSTSGLMSVGMLLMLSVLHRSRRLYPTLPANTKDSNRRATSR